MIHMHIAVFKDVIYAPTIEHVYTVSVYVLLKHVYTLVATI